MKIYDSAVAVQIRLEAAQSADASGYLGAAATRFVETIDSVSGYLEGVAQFKSRVAIDGSPSMDKETTTAAISKFRTELSRRGGEALQQESAGKLLNVAKEQNARAQRWVKVRWKSLFSDIQPLLEEAAPERLGGNSTERYAVMRLAAKLSKLERQDPVSDANGISEALGTAWTNQLRELRGDLARALQQVKDSVAALTPEVQEALASASSEGGLSLADITVELLQKLRASGVDEDLVVRRR